MASSPAAPTESDVAVAAMVYSRRIGDAQAVSEGRRLRELLDHAKYGMVINCEAIEMGTSEVVNVLLKISKRAKKDGKYLALYNVPKTLAKTIKIASLNSVLLVFDDGILAKRDIYSRAGVKDPAGYQFRMTLKYAIIFAVFSVSLLIAVIVWLWNS